MHYRVRAVLRDRDGGLGEAMLRFNPPSSFAAAQANTIEPFLSALEPITDAVAVRFMAVWSDDISDAVAPSIANLESRALFIFRTVVGTFGGLVVASPKASIFETTGDYAGVRVLTSVCDSVKTLLNTIGVSSPLTPNIHSEVVDVRGYRIV